MLHPVPRREQDELKEEKGSLKFKEEIRTQC